MLLDLTCPLISWLKPTDLRHSIIGPKRSLKLILSIRAFPELSLELMTCSMATSLLAIAALHAHGGLEHLLSADYQHTSL